jgi:CoA:oxalate CoA-transferase
MCVYTRLAMGALDGFRVVEAGLNVQGPQAAAVLRDWGADVIKVELPGVGDQSRSLPAAPDDERSGYFIACNRGKRSITIDLRRPAGAEVFLRLTQSADVVIANFKPGTMDSWGLGYEVLAARNPQLIYGMGSTFGPRGPDALREGTDLSGQAAGGLISTTGVDGGEPTPVGATVADHIASLNLAAGILAALLARARTGRGQRVDASLIGGQIWAQASEVTAYLLSGTVPGRANHGSALVPGLYSLFPTADGWIAISGVRGPQRAVFFGLMGRSDLLERHGTGLYSSADKQTIYSELSPIFKARTTLEWCKILQEGGIRHAAVRDYQQIVEDPGVWENEYLVRSPSGQAMVGTPVQFSDTPGSATAEAPELGQHTEEILLEFGYTWGEISGFSETGVI